MPTQLASPQPSGAITIAARHVEAGRFRLPRADRHRVMVHVSAVTRTYCSHVGKYFVRRAGDIDFVPAGEEGGFEAETSFDALELGLSPALLESVATELEGGADVCRFETRHLLRDERIVHLVRALDHDFRANSPGGSLFANSVGIALAVRLLGLGEAEVVRTTRQSDVQLKRVLHHIDAHLETSLTLQTLSAVAGVSNSHLRTWFKAATGMTVHRYVLRRRVERAHSLLSTRDLSVNEVAHLAGFAHQSHLAHWMRRELGETPRGLQRRIRVLK
jgi:AraC family transcriptional regulator